jgi:hypothetical protein
LASSVYLCSEIWSIRCSGIFVNPFEQGPIGPDLFRATYDVGREGLVSKRGVTPRVVAASASPCRAADCRAELAALFVLGPIASGARTRNAVSQKITDQKPGKKTCKSKCPQHAQGTPEEGI